MLYIKRAQFFLAAALILVVIVFSFGTIYNSAQVSSNSPGKVSSLASEIKYELVQVVNNGVFNNLTDSEISGNIINLSSYYSELYPQYRFVVVYGSSYSSMFAAKEFSKGAMSDIPVIAGQNITLTLNNLQYSLQVLKGYNLHVIVQSESQDERYIAQA